MSLFILILSSFLHGSDETAETTLQSNLENRVVLAQKLEPYLAKQKFPEKLPLKLSSDGEKEYNINYTLDSDLQEAAEDLLQRYKPDYSAIFMMDAKTGKVLVYASYQKDSTSSGSLLKKASYPAASIFKIVTATAAVDKSGLSPQHKIRFNGGNWTLFKKNVMMDQINRWTRTVSLREAFAKSMNTPFGKIGLNLEPGDLENYAGRYMFNQQIPADFPVDPGIALIPTEKSFQLSEVACGYNKQNRMSPVQGAMIAATVINEGKMVVPYLVESITDQDSRLVHSGLSLEAGSVMSAESAAKVKELMKETIVSGTSRRSFGTLRKNKKFQIVEMGGKTGHLTGDDPKGRVDWFVGYASSGDRQIAIGAVTVNKKYWTVKSSYIGQTLFKKAFSETANAVATNP